MPKPIDDALTLDRDNGYPLAEQIERKVLDLLEEGRLRPGDKLPREVELCQALGVSRWTVREALGRLVERGLLRRVRRSGTFVTERAARPSAVGFFYFSEARNVLLSAIHLMHAAFAAKGIELKIVPLDLDDYRRADLVAETERLRLDGAVLVAMDTPECREQLLLLESRGFPYVRMGNKCFVGQLRAPLVTGDDRRATRDALACLGSFGHRRIGYVSSHARDERRDEYLAFSRRLPGFTPRWLGRVPFTGTMAKWRENGAESQPLLREYLEANPDITAIVFEHGGMAAKLVQLAGEMGRGVPERLSVISLEDWNVTFSMISPGITAMRAPRDAEAERAAERLLRLLDEGPPESEELIRVPFEMIERESVAPPCDP